MSRLAIAAAILLTASAARADPENALGLGPEAAARASAVSATGIGVPAVHYDPAALSLAEDRTTELELAFLWAEPVLSVDALDGGTPMRPAEPDATTAIFAGTRFDLGTIFDVHGLHAAFAVYSPVDHIFLYETHPDDRPQWLMWGERTQHVIAWLGLGLRIADWLAIGASVRVMFDIELFTTGRVRRLTSEETVTAETELGEELRVIGHAAPIVGALISPIDGVRAGLVWRGALRLEEWGWARVTGATEGFGAPGYVYRFSHAYRPHEIAFSAAWEPSRDLAVSAELTWQLWSRAVGGTFQRLPGRYGDTLVPALSGRLSLVPGISAMAGYRYVRSPFDNFGGPTNLLDNDRHEPSLGMAFALSELTGDRDLPIVLSWAFRLALMEAREERKDWQRFASDDDLTSNPGYPGYRHGGLVPSLQLGAEAAW